MSQYVMVGAWFKVLLPQQAIDWSSLIAQLWVAPAAMAVYEPVRDGGSLVCYHYFPNRQSIGLVLIAQLWKSACTNVR